MSQNDKKQNNHVVMSIPSLIIMAVVLIGIGIYIGTGFVPMTPTGSTAGMSEMPPGNGSGAGSQMANLSDDEIISAINQSDNLQMLISIGNQMFDAGRPKVASSAYEKALKMDPDNADVRTDLGTMYLDAGRADDAIVQFQAASRIDPKHENSRYNLGIAYLQGKHDHQKAMAVWEGYLKAFPNGAHASDVQRQLLELKANNSSQ